MNWNSNQQSFQQNDWFGTPGGGSSSNYFDDPVGSPMQPQQQSSMGMFMPSPEAVPSQGFDEDEQPLLEELGINFSHIREKTLAVLNPVGSAGTDVLRDQDMAGPLVFCLLYGAALLLHGKPHFGYVYGIGALGCLSIFCLLNLMSADGISLTLTVSVLGYCLLPMALLTLLAALLPLGTTLTLVLAISSVLWCSISAAKLFATALLLDHQRPLVAYPCSLLYGVFALLAIF